MKQEVFYIYRLVYIRSRKKYMVFVANEKQYALNGGGGKPHLEALRSKIDIEAILPKPHCDNFKKGQRIFVISKNVLHPATFCGKYLPRVMPYYSPTTNN